METSFYEDERMMSKKPSFKGTMNKLRSGMTLDFNNGPPAKKRSIGQLLASPDLNMLKLASPELEKIIIQHNNGLVTTTPTPTTQILFPKSVTEEQEAYARGFVDALEKLQNGDEGESSDSSNSKEGQFTSGQSKAATDVTYTMLQNASSRLLTVQNGTAPVSVSSNYNFTTVTSLPDSLLNNSDEDARASNASFVPSTVTAHSPLTINSQDDVPRISSPYMIPNNRVLNFKEEPQTVPSIGSTPPMSPINMDDQEQQKVDRKRARNRVAARKCRYRKLERISRLEDRVTELKNQNSQLSSDATALKEQVLRLKKHILEHVNSGCNIMVTSSVL